MARPTGGLLEPLATTQPGCSQVYVPVERKHVRAALLRDDIFRMYGFKVMECPDPKSHDWGDCPFTHPSENAHRRCPVCFAYLPVACPSYKQQQHCELGDCCIYAHGDHEIQLHPLIYRTVPCCKSCKPDSSERLRCWFAHTDELQRSGLQADQLQALKAAAHHYPQSVLDHLVEEMDRQAREDLASLMSQTSLGATNALSERGSQGSLSAGSEYSSGRSSPSSALGILSCARQTHAQCKIVFEVEEHARQALEHYNTRPMEHPPKKDGKEGRCPLQAPQKVSSSRGALPPDMDRLRTQLVNAFDQGRSPRVAYEVANPLGLRIIRKATGRNSTPLRGPLHLTEADAVRELGLAVCQEALKDYNRSQGALQEYNRCQQLLRQQVPVQPPAKQLGAGGQLGRGCVWQCGPHARPTQPRSAPPSASQQLPPDLQEALYLLQYGLPAAPAAVAYIAHASVADGGGNACGARTPGDWRYSLEHTYRPANDNCFSLYSTDMGLAPAGTAWPQDAGLLPAYFQQHNLAAPCVTAQTEVNPLHWAQLSAHDLMAQPPPAVLDIGRCAVDTPAPETGPVPAFNILSDKIWKALGTAA